MKLKELLLEEFKTGTKETANKKYAEIYENPSNKEMENASATNEIINVTYKSKHKKIRFLANSGKVYVFPTTLLHHKALKALGMNSKNEAPEKTFEGIAELRGNKWILVESHYLERLKEQLGLTVGATKRLKEYINLNWNFINRYININEYMQNFLESIRKYKGFKTLKI